MVRGVATRLVFASCPHAPSSIRPPRMLFHYNTSLPLFALTMAFDVFFLRHKYIKKIPRTQMWVVGPQRACFLVGRLLLLFFLGGCRECGAGMDTETSSGGRHGGPSSNGVASSSGSGGGEDCRRVSVVAESAYSGVGRGCWRYVLWRTIIDATKPRGGRGRG